MNRRNGHGKKSPPEAARGRDRRNKPVKSLRGGWTSTGNGHRVVAGTAGQSSLASRWESKAPKAEGSVTGKRNPWTQDPLLSERRARHP
ncbi:MAG: hypothetical protein OEU68_03580 [Nitrospira sp.]|nr:hypothetical protein [Nitrospira sp.]MDH4244920.1 hypothetical protein [Nitrospira sp.]MDH4354814.1 hypothetical protein [Nitrospira sp.]MDH5317112.1 hypothetical protein [Nitrospira sp.]